MTLLISTRRAWIVCLMLSVLVTTSIHGQGHVPGEFIAMFHDGLDAKKFGAEYGLNHIQVLS
ncbi:MAG: hypothetical protein O2791_04870, partial [Bacteroidetes bacterium]|nr:hypothetical protein [Bacteroidota bacterium]